MLHPSLTSTNRQFSALVRQAQGSVGLMLFLQLDLDAALTVCPQARDWGGRRLVRLIVGNPVTMGQMTRRQTNSRGSSSRQLCRRSSSAVSDPARWRCSAWWKSPSNMA